MLYALVLVVFCLISRKFLTYACINSDSGKIEILRGSKICIQLPADRLERENIFAGKQLWLLELVPDSSPSINDEKYGYNHKYYLVLLTKSKFRYAIILN